MKRHKWACPQCNCDDPGEFGCDCPSIYFKSGLDGWELHGETRGYPCPDAYCDRCGWSGTFPQPPVNPAEEKATMITLRKLDGSAFIEVAIPRNEAALIAPHLAPGWRFVEEVEIAPVVSGAVRLTSGDVVAEIKQEAPKPAKKPRAKAAVKEPKVKERNQVVENAVLARLSAGDGSPKSFAELIGYPLDDSAIRAALEALRAAGEVVVTGQKRGTKYQLVERPTAPTAPTTAQAAE